MGICRQLSFLPLNVVNFWVAGQLPGTAGGHIRRYAVYP